MKRLQRELRRLRGKQRDPVRHIVDMCSRYVDGPCLKFIEQQVQMYFKHRKGRRWTSEQKRVALALHFKSPASYNFLRTIFALPSLTSLRRWISGVETNPGYNENVLNIMQARLTSMDAMKKVVVVSFDEMSLSVGLKYEKYDDMIVGFQDLGPGIGRATTRASQALVVMVRCLFDKWKQPIGYFFSGNAMKGHVLKQIIEEGVKRLLHIGFDVRAIVCDQGSNNRSAFMSLGVTEDKPFFDVDQHRVWCLYDPPHLIKSVRNNFRKYGAVFESKKSAQWKHIEDFYQQDSQAPKFSLAPKLTNAHIFTPAFKTMRVCLATQVLSRTVAAAINTYVSVGKLTSPAVHTAEFIAKWNDIFDSVNGRTFKVCENLKKPAKTTSPHLSFWVESIEWIKGMRFNTSFHTHCLTGWKLTLQAMIGLMGELQSAEGFKFLLTSRLNQDCLENLFAVIRQKGGNRDNPDPNHFRFTFRQILCNSLITPSSSSNCAPDADSILLTLSELNKVHTQTGSTCRASSASSISATFFDTSDLSYEYEADVLDSNGVNYVLGYVLKKLNVSCDTCNTSLLYRCNLMCESSQLFTHMKAVSTSNRDFGGLTVPSEELVQSFHCVHSSVIVPFLSDMSNLVGTKVNSRLTKSVTAQLSHLSLCRSCLLKIVNAYCRIAIFWKIHQLNNSFRASQMEKKSRKSLILKHL